ncbi:SDR family oxidoreductase [Pedobacter sp. HMF7647]|uniref:SDR family oxidoreductase n=1 Tax=Hufsiella arboris TaxID=2695275 RepID=A0A7K1YCN1_9SPHI|nr:SDR family oxidoreductase [Hufsiella arboris]MXV52334.1 SDR family oxidoreductase [Hufsiella arboris]
MKQQKSIAGQTIVITGASSGAGLAIALELAAYQPKLVLASRNEQILKEVASECEAAGAEVLVVPTDVTEKGAMISLASAANKAFGKIDVWVNNAGVLAVGEFDKTPLEIHDQVIKTNLLGYIHGAHAVMPYFKGQQYGTLINNISIGGFLPVPYGTGYSASKFGLRGFSEALRAELSVWPDIYVCDLFPAFLDTPGIRHAGNYTGKVIKPAPPVYDPRRVAKAVVSLVQNPRSSVSVGSASSVLRLAHALFPAVTTRSTRLVMNTYLKQAKTTPATSGNLFNSLDFGHSIFGGHGIPGKPKAHRKYIAVGLLFSAALGAFALLKRN